jgi:hypothetical protein
MGYECITAIDFFCRDEISMNDLRISDAGRVYELIKTIVYPKASELINSIEDQVEEIKFQLSCIYFTAQNRMGWDEEEDAEEELRIHFVCELEKLWEKLAVQRICIDRAELRRVLQEAGFKNDDGKESDGILIVTNTK